MINLKKDFPVKTEIISELQNKTAQIRDLLIEMDQLIAIYEATKDCYLTRAETADYFRCSKQQIPKQIPHIRRGNDLLYKKSDIDEYVKTRTVPR